MPQLFPNKQQPDCVMFAIGTAQRTQRPAFRAPGLLLQSCGHFLSVSLSVSLCVSVSVSVPLSLQQLQHILSSARPLLKKQLEALATRRKKEKFTLKDQSLFPNSSVFRPHTVRDFLFHQKRAFCSKELLFYFMLVILNCNNYPFKMFLL